MKKKFAVSLAVSFLVGVMGCASSDPSAEESAVAAQPEESHVQTQALADDGVGSALGGAAGSALGGAGSGLGGAVGSAINCLHLGDGCSSPGECCTGHCTQEVVVGGRQCSGGR